MYCHIHHCHYHHCHCVPKDSKEKGGALTQEELLALTEEMKDELKDYTVDLKDQIFSYIDIGVNPVEIANTFASLKEQDTYILRTLTNTIDELNNTTNLSMFNLRARVTSLEGQSASILQDLAVLEGKTDTNTLDLSDRTQRIDELENNLSSVMSFTTDVNKFGDFSANPKAVIQLAIDSVCAAGGGVIDVPAGVFDFSSGGFVIKEGVHIRCAGSGVTIFDQGEWEGDLISTPVLTPTALTLSNNLSIGDTSNTITNNCKKGDLVRYYSSLYFTRRWTDVVVREGYKEGELMVISEATPTTLSFETPVFIDCNLTDNPIVDYFTPTRNMKVTGVTLKKSDNVVNTSRGLVWDWVADCWHDDVETIGYDSSGIAVHRSVRVNVGKTYHIGGSDTLGLCYGTSWSNGTRDCHQQLVVGTECRNVIAGGGYWAVPAYITVDQIQATRSKSHAIDTHAGTAYFTYKSANTDRAGSMSGLGHRVMNVNATALAADYTEAGIGAYEGGIDLHFQNIHAVNHGRFFSLYPVLNSTFKDISITSDKFHVISFSAGDGKSTGNTFENIKLMCPKAANALTTEEANSCHTRNTASGFTNVLGADCVVRNLTITGFPIAVSTSYPRITLTNVTANNCGWVSGLGNHNLVRLGGESNMLLGFESTSTNTALDWSAGISLVITKNNCTVKNFSNNLSNPLAVPLFDCSIAIGVADAYLNDVYITAARKFELNKTTASLFVNTDLIPPVPPARRKGTTAQRPTGVSDGFVYLDTTLNQVVTFIDGDWVDATGAVV